MLKIIQKIVGTKNDRELKRIRPVIQQAESLEEELSQLDNEGLRAKTDEFRQRIREHSAEERENSRRT